MGIEIVNCPIKSGDFPLCKRLPEGKYGSKSHGISWDIMSQKMSFYNLQISHKIGISLSPLLAPENVPSPRLIHVPIADSSRPIGWDPWGLGPSKKHQLYWLVVSTPLKNISQLGALFQIYGKIKNVPNHQPVYLCCRKKNWFNSPSCSVK